jgi:hypothetical protein
LLLDQKIGTKTNITKWWKTMIDVGLKKIYKLILKEKYDIAKIHKINRAIFVYLQAKKKTRNIHGVMERNKESAALRPQNWLEDLMGGSFYGV